MNKILRIEDITYSAQFVPFSEGRNSKEKYLSLNWKITLSTRYGLNMVTDYHQGIGHLPIRSSTYADKYCVEDGKYLSEPDQNNVQYFIALPEPKIEDILGCLISDAQCCDGQDFEEFADEFGYDKDSRSAEKIFNSCLHIYKELTRLGISLNILEQEFIDGSVNNMIYDYAQSDLVDIPHQCTCSMMTIMRAGCECGGV